MKDEIVVIPFTVLHENNAYSIQKEILISFGHLHTSKETVTVHYANENLSQIIEAIFEQNKYKYQNQWKLKR